MLAQSGNLNITWQDLENVSVPNFAGGTIGDLLSGRGKTTGFIVFTSAFAGLLLLIYLIYGGLQLLTSGGDPKKVESGKSIITNAVFGFVIIIVAFLIVQVVGLFLGLSGITNVFGG